MAQWTWWTKSAASPWRRELQEKRLPAASFQRWLSSLLLNTKVSIWAAFLPSRCAPLRHSVPVHPGGGWNLEARITVRQILLGLQDLLSKTELKQSPAWSLNGIWEKGSSASQVRVLVSSGPVSLHKGRDWFGKNSHPQQISSLSSSHWVLGGLGGRHLHSHLWHTVSLPEVYKGKDLIQDTCFIRFYSIFYNIHPKGWIILFS